MFFAVDACAAFSVNAAAALCFPDEDVDTRRSAGTFDAAGLGITFGAEDLDDRGGFDFDTPDLGGFDFAAPDLGGFDFPPDLGGFDFAPDLGGDDFTEAARGGADFGEAARGGADFGVVRCAGFGSGGASSSSSHSGFTSIVR